MTKLFKIVRTCTNTTLYKLVLWLALFSFSFSRTDRKDGLKMRIQVSGPVYIQHIWNVLPLTIWVG